VVRAALAVKSFRLKCRNYGDKIARLDPEPGEGLIHTRHRLLRGFARGGIQDQNIRPRLCQIQHVVECSSKLIGRPRSDSSQRKVVFHEAHD